MRDLSTPLPPRNRGTVADSNGNISIQEEAVSSDVLAQASHCKACGGKVFCQVSRIVSSSSELERIDIPGCLIDG